MDETEPLTPAEGARDAGGDGHVLVIVNPVSGRGDPAPLQERVEGALDAAGVSWQLRLTTGPGDAFAWARDARDVKRVIVVGGDGTVMEAMSGLVHAGLDVPLAQIPTGTANVLALALGVPTDDDAAVELAMHGADMPFDVGYLPDHERYFALAAGVGWHAQLVDDASRELKDRLGLLAYLVTGVKNLFELQLSEVTVEVDGEIERFRAHSAMLVNVGALQPGGAGFGERVSPHDGKLDLVLLSERSAAGLARLLYRLAVDDLSDDREVLHVASSRVRIDADPPLSVQIDGESLGTTPLEAEVVPDGVRLVVPQAYLRASRTRLAKSRPVS